MTDTNKTDLTPEDLAEMHERATYWNPPARDQCIGEDHMARDVLELLDEVERLRRQRVDMDCRYTMGSVADIFGSHCPLDRSCVRCTAEQEIERLRALLAACAKSPGYAACLRECKEDHQ